MIASLVEGGKGCVGIAATCATAGIIVSIINLTGLGLKLSGLIVDLGGGSLLITILLAAFAMWLLGTAVPVTASYIIAAVVLVPGAHFARRARARRAYVHVLLRGSRRCLAAHRARAFRGLGHLRRQAVPNHASGLEIHAPRLRRAGDDLPVATRRRPPVAGRLEIDSGNLDHLDRRAHRLRIGGGRLDRHSRHAA